MINFGGKVAVISGGAEGIGLSIAKAAAAQGMKVVLADIDAQQLEVARGLLADQGADVLPFTMDVTNPSAWQSLAEQVIATFGKVHMLVNNAGVGGTTGPIEKTNHKDWQWVLDVNLMGVIYGTEVFTPLMKQHGEGGWLINVASMAGMGGVPFGGAYTATKVAVVGMSESWHGELKPHGIHVSVLCPAFVKTRINHSYRNKQDKYKNDATPAKPSAKSIAIAEHMQQVINAGLEVDIVGERVIEAIQAQELYIFTHPNYRPVVQRRAKAIDDAFARAEKSPLLAHMLDQEIVGFS
jgi:NAD(P)-dependent dehydrogenase (short-subunit alcohol dehydrogenase family)